MLATSRLRWQTLASALVLGCGLVHLWLDRPEAPTKLVEPPVVIEVPAHPTVAVAPTPPPVSMTAPVPITPATCPTDIARVGVPIAERPENVNAPPLVDVAVARDGCTLAARTATALEISWDGGQTFGRHALASADSMVAVASRVFVQRAGELGTIAPGQAIEWRPVPAKLAKSRLLAAGKWTVLVTDGLAGISEDDGASWRYLDVPAEISVLRVGVDGRVFGTRTNIIVPFDGEGNGAISTTHVAADVLHPSWRSITTHAGSPADDTGRYALEPDEFWGCGGSEKLVWTDGRRLTAGSLRSEVWPIEVRTTGKVTFASLQNQLVRLDRTKRIEVGEMPGLLVGVDASGTAIVQTGTRVLRWSKAGGWRVLLDAP